jgi:hypothetical protein
MKHFLGQIKGEASCNHDAQIVESEVTTSNLS